MGFSFWFFTSRNEPKVPLEASENVSNDKLEAAEPQETKPAADKPVAPANVVSPENKNLSAQPATERPVANLDVKEAVAKPIVDSQGVLRDSQGALIKTRHESAIKACADQGMQLASIRELVTWGGKILETGAEMEEPIPSGYSKELVIAINSDGKKDSFYYVYNSSGGAFRPSGDLRDSFVWSSSMNAKNRSEYYAFEATSGYVSSGESSDPDPKFHNGAVRCMAKPKSKR